MNKPLRILHLEDDPDYCDLVRSLLKKEGFRVELTVARDRAQFEAALAPGSSISSWRITCCRTMTACKP